jgi:hypothetical protein
MRHNAGGGFVMYKAERQKLDFNEGVDTFAISNRWKTLFFFRHSNFVISDISARIARVQQPSIERFS